LDGLQGWHEKNRIVKPGYAGEEMGSDAMQKPDINLWRAHNPNSEELKRVQLHITINR